MNKSAVHGWIRQLLLGTCLLALVALSGCATRPNLALADYQTVTTNDGHSFTAVKVFYATDRAPLGMKGGRPEFSSERNKDPQPLQYGYVNVSIPPNHKEGENEQQPWYVRPFVGPRPTNYVELLDGKVLSRTELMASLSGHGNTGNSVLLFIHGYNNTFEEAATRTALLGWDVSFPGHLMFFSWPSKGKTEAYTVDATTEEWAVADLVSVLEDLDKTAGTDHITIIAHSMGNQVLSKALVAVDRLDPTFYKKVSRIIMAAPDVDADVFERLYAWLYLKAPATTLYVSSRDYAMLSSETVNGGRRLGDFRAGPVVLPSIETVDASAVKMDFVGHAYISDSPTVLNDVRVMVHQGTAAADRPHMKSAVNAAQQTYWQLLP